MTTAIVTGASSGLGLEIARLMAARGDSVVAVARRRESLEALAEQFDHVTPLALDVSTPEGRDALLALTPSADVLVNNAGFGALGDFAATDVAVANEMVAINVAALTDLTGRYLAGMVERRRGRVLNVASTAAFQPGPHMAVYFASKAYVLSFTEAIAHELRGSGVTATAFCPGAFASGFQELAGVEHTKLVKGRALPSARDMARDALAAMDRGTVVRVPGALNKLNAQGVRLLPRSLSRRSAEWAMS